MPSPPRAPDMAAPRPFGHPPTATKRVHSDATPGAPITAQLWHLRNAAPSSGSGSIMAAPPLPLPRTCHDTRQVTAGNAPQLSRTVSAPTNGTLDSDSDDGWGSDFDDDELTPAERAWCEARFDWEERRMAGRVGEPPPVPPRLRNT
ncbi:hypothetical protein [Stenotrophomonas sp. PD6]|uniref:hypothetical protein n=1 Tax=Stenotrophomonas sp. PD6 TaxID=3368612 RepID=UPI003BA24E3E